MSAPLKCERLIAGLKSSFAVNMYIVFGIGYGEGAGAGQAINLKGFELAVVPR